MAAQKTDARECSRVLQIKRTFESDVIAARKPKSQTFPECRVRLQNMGLFSPDKIAKKGVS